MARLTCASCYASRLVDAATLVDGITIGMWWTELRYHSCSVCFAHTCWQEVEETVCFLDAGHSGRHLPWKESYGDTVDGTEPLLDLWETS